MNQPVATSIPFAGTPAATPPLGLVSVIIPCRPGGNWSRAVEGLRVIHYPSDQLEVIIAEGKSPSRQRNAAVQQASGDMLFFLDNDSIPATDWLDRAEEAFSAFPGAEGAGGPNVTPPDDNFWQCAFGCALGSEFAHASMACRYRPIGEMRLASEKELILCGMMVRRKTFVKLGGFDESLFPNEENEFMNRITRSGGKLVYHPGARVLRSRRKNVIQFFRQMMKYGRGRMEQTFVEKFHPANAFFLAPLVFTIYLIGLAFFPNPLFFIPLVGYLAAGFISAHGFSRSENRPGLELVLPFLYIIMHGAYSAGLVAGLVRRLRGPDAAPQAGPIEVRVVKAFGAPW